MSAVLVPLALSQRWRGEMTLTPDPSPTGRGEKPLDQPMEVLVHEPVYR
ncbi:MAG: hypothetical protein ANABAC_1529 [Anaerolineae bacterium]|nr:MAG: hypothetical protein ANABAC_1529 [Anaerolineae bacterium]